MMKPLRWIMFALIGLLAMACAPAPTAAPTPLPTEAAPEAAASTHPTEDISLVGATGRPQFLDSFAHW